MNSLKFECYLLLSVLILSLFGCDKEETVQGYYIKNLKGLDLEKIQVYEFSLDSALLFGFRDQKIWIGLFDNHTKKQLHEWESLNVYKEKEYKIDYGRTITWNIEAVSYTHLDVYKRQWKNSFVRSFPSGFVCRLHCRS